MYRLSFAPLENASSANQLQSLPRPIILIDGFESGLLFTDAYRGPPALPEDEWKAECAEGDRLSREMVTAILLTGVRTLVWYGQDYFPNSFTSLVPRIAQRQRDLTLVALLDETRRDAFKASWSQPAVAQLRVMVFTVRVPDDASAARQFLATRAVESIEPDHLFCYGGGVAAAHAVQACQSTSEAVQAAVEVTVADAAALIAGQMTPSAIFSQSLAIDDVITSEISRAMPEIPPHSLDRDLGEEDDGRGLALRLVSVQGIEADDLPSGESGEPSSLWCKVVLKQPLRVQFRRSQHVPCAAGHAELQELVTRSTRTARSPWRTWSRERCALPTLTSWALCADGSDTV